MLLLEQLQIMHKLSRHTKTLSDMAGTKKIGRSTDEQWGRCQKVSSVQQYKTDFKDTLSHISNNSDLNLTMYSHLRCLIMYLISLIMIWHYINKLKLNWIEKQLHGSLLHFQFDADLQMLAW